jgi:hypothetical protein
LSQQLNLAVLLPEAARAVQFSERGHNAHGLRVYEAEFSVKTSLPLDEKM